jgi:hypothetical protein
MIYASRNVVGSYANIKMNVASDRHEVFDGSLRLDGTMRALGFAEMHGAIELRQ